MWNRVAWKQILLHHQRPASKQLRPSAVSWFEVTTPPHSTHPLCNDNLNKLMNLRQNFVDFLPLYLQKTFIYTNQPSTLKVHFVCRDIHCYEGCDAIQPNRPTSAGFSSSANSNWHSGGLRLAAFEPVSPNDLHRAGGIASFMRLPIVQPPKAFGDLDVAFLGIPLDTATSNRPGAR